MNEYLKKYRKNKSDNVLVKLRKTMIWKNVKVDVVTKFIKDEIKVPLMMILMILLLILMVMGSLYLYKICVTSNWIFCSM